MIIYSYLFLILIVLFYDSKAVLGYNQVVPLSPQHPKYRSDPDLCLQELGMCLIWKRLKIDAKKRKKRRAERIWVNALHHAFSSRPRSGSSASV